ncbi:hypothetical protein HaLaN_25064, partial [Haematococcus lacustris]
MPRESLHALDVALRQGAASDPLTRVVGRGLYTERGRTKIGEGGYEVRTMTATGWPRKAKVRQTLPIVVAKVSFKD